MQLQLGCRAWKQKIAYADFSSMELQLLETRCTDLKFLNVEIYVAIFSKSVGCLTVLRLPSWTRDTRLPHRRCAFGPEQQQHPNLQFHIITALLHPPFQTPNSVPLDTQQRHKFECRHVAITEAPVGRWSYRGTRNSKYWIKSWNVISTDNVGVSYTPLFLVMRGETRKL